jgi:hypothetical protein
MKPSNWRNYSANICQIDQGTMVLVMAHRKKMSRYDKLHNIHGLCQLDELSSKGGSFSSCVWQAPLEVTTPHKDWGVCTWAILSQDMQVSKVYCGLCVFHSIYPCVKKITVVICNVSRLGAENGQFRHHRASNV